MAETTDQKPHVALFPYPLQGHIIPFVHLATKLASNGFTVTFVNTESIHHQMSKSQSDHGEDMFTEPRKLGLDIRCATVSDGFPLQFDRSLNHDQFFEGILHVYSAHVDELVGKLVLSDPPVNCLIVDTFYVWSSYIAKKYNLVCVSFWTEPALVFTLYYHMDLRTAPTTVVHRIIAKAFEDVRKVDFVVANTVQELESETISAMLENQPFYAIGPIFPPGFPKSSVATSLWSESDCSHWLNTKPDGSVLYVSFGSYAHTTKHEIVEIANGLELSGVNFVWVLRPDIISSTETDYLPAGYEERIRNRGLIVTWCSQMEVISHPAIGGFLTHCGWNSILESIWCRVPLICYPLLTDQFTNRKLVVDDWKIGINLTDQKSVTSEEVAEKVRKVITGKSCEKLRHEIEKVRKELGKALEIEGSSQLNFLQFIKDVKARISKYSSLA